MDDVARDFETATVSLAPGEHEVVARLGGFEASRVKVSLASGGTRDLELRLKAHDTEDREVLQLVASGSKLWVQPFEEPSVKRGGPSEGPAVRVVYPRGKVRVADLEGVRVEWDGASTLAGALVYRHGDKELSRESVTLAAREDILRTVPQSVRGAVKAGDQITWGFFPGTGTPTTASFHVVEDSVKEALVQLEKVTQGQPPAALAHLRAQVLLDAELLQAAYFEARRVLDDGRPSARAWATMIEALDRMGAPPGTRAWGEAHGRLSALPPQERAQAYPPRGKTHERLLLHLTRGQAGRALPLIDDPLRAEWRSRPERALEVAGTLARSARELAAAAPGGAARVSDELIGATRTAYMTASADPTVVRALGESLLARARLDRYSGDAPPAGRFVEAAEFLLQGAALDPEHGAQHRRAVEMLLEAIPSPSADAAALRAQARATAEEAAKLFPGEPEAVAADGLLRLEELQRVPLADRKGAAQKAQATLDVLEPMMARVSDAPRLGTLHADVVTFVRERELAVKTAYRTTTVESQQGMLRAEVPNSPRWRVEADSGPAQLLTLARLGVDGEVERLITVRSFRSGETYSFPQGPSVGGENTGQIAKFDLADAERAVARTSKVVRPKATPFSPRYPRSYFYQLEGEDLDGARLDMRSWIFRSDAFPYSYQVVVRDFAPTLGDMEPELRFVLDSLTDEPREKTTR